MVARALWDLRLLIVACAAVAALAFDVRKIRDMKQIVAPHESAFEQALEKDASSFATIRATQANPCIVGPWGDWGKCTASSGGKGKAARTGMGTARLTQGSPGWREFFEVA